MKPINVIVNGVLYKWVDTVVMTDERDYAVAVLIQPKAGRVSTVCLSEVFVIDKDVTTKKENYCL